MMTKNISKIGMAIMLLLALSGCKQEMFTNDLGAFDPNSDLGLYEVQLSRPGNTDGEIYLDISTGTVYTYADAVQQPEKIDLIMLWNSASASNIIAPWDIDRLRDWDKGEEINEEWFVKNETRFIRLESSAAGDALYDGIKAMADIQPAYDALKVLVESQSNYSPALHGEATALAQLAAGDIVGVRTDKNVYGIARIQNTATSNTSNLRMSFKVDKRNEVSVPALPASEERTQFEFTADKLSDMSGDNLFNLATGVQRRVTEAYYSQNQTDAAFYMDGAGVTVSSMNHTLPLLGQDMIEVESDWEQRNETRFVRVRASAEATSLFDRAYTNSRIREAFSQAETIVSGYSDYDQQIYGPTLSVAGVEVGDVFVYHSVSRNVYGVIRITDVGTDFVDGRGRASAHGLTNPPAPQLKEFTSTGAATSTAIYVDLKTGTIYTTEATAEANAANIDVISLRGSNTGNNFIPLSSHQGAISYGTAWGNRIATWPNRQEGYAYSLGISAASWNLYHSLREDVSMWDVFQTETAGMTAPTRVTQVTNREIIFFHGVGRNILVALKVLDTSTATSITYRYKIIEL